MSSLLSPEQRSSTYLVGDELKLKERSQSVTEQSGVSPPADEERPRQRYQACERCWKRKQKCDKLLPSCKTCTEAGVPCKTRSQEWNAPNPAQQLGTPSVASYLDSLKRKVDSLEDQHRHRRRRLTTISTTATPPQESIRQSRTGEGSVSTASAVGEEENGDPEGNVRATMGEIGLLALGAMAEPHEQSGRFPRHLALDNVLTAAVAVENTDPSRPSPSKKFPLQAFMANQTVSITRETTSEYLGRFLDRIGVSLPYLDHGLARQHYDHLVHTSSIHMLEPLDDLELWNFQIHMFIAIGMMISPESTRLESVALNLHATARKTLPAVLEHGHELSVIYCLISLIMFSLYNPSGGSTWHLLGLTMRKAISLQLYKEPEMQAGLSELEVLCRRNTFWTLYMLDRTLSTILDRPFSIEDKDITMRPLQETSNESQNLVAGKFGSYFVAQARLMSNIRTKRDNGSLFCYTNTCYWRDSCLALRHSIPSHDSWYSSIDQLFCRALIQVVLLRADWTYNFFSIQEGGINLQNDVTQACDRYINQVHNRHDQGGVIGSFVDGYDMFAAGIMFICLSSQPAGRDNQADLHITRSVSNCSNILTVLSERFSSFRALRRVLTALSHRVMGRLHDKLETEILHNLPHVVPRQIRNFIMKFISQHPGVLG